MALAVFCLMFGFAFDFALSFKTGGVLMLATCGFLLVKAQQAATRPYRSTETWIMLPKDQRPAPTAAQKIIGGVLRAVFLKFALWTAGIAVLFLAIAAFIMMFLPGAGLK